MSTTSATFTLHLDNYGEGVQVTVFPDEPATEPVTSVVFEFTDTVAEAVKVVTDAGYTIHGAVTNAERVGHHTYPLTRTEQS